MTGKEYWRLMMLLIEYMATRGLSVRVQRVLYDIIRECIKANEPAAFKDGAYADMLNTEPDYSEIPF